MTEHHFFSLSGRAIFRTMRSRLFSNTTLSSCSRFRDDSSFFATFIPHSRSNASKRSSTTVCSVSLSSVSVCVAGVACSCASRHASNRRVQAAGVGKESRQ